MATEGGRISPPGCWGGSQPPPVAGSIFFFFFFFWVAVGSPEKSPEVGGGWWRPSPEVGGGLFIWLLDLLIGYFDFIFNLYIFLKLLRCQLMNSGQKTPPFCHDHMIATPILK
jgi:hypothetical protein